MAGNLEIMLRRTRAVLNEHRRLRYKRFTTTSAGAAAGTTIISTELTELDDTFNGCQAIVLDGDAEGERKIVEDFTASSDTLSFTNNPFSVLIASGVTVELTENGAWSGEDLKQYLISAINLIAGLASKTALRNYLRKTTVGSISGVASLSGLKFIDIHYIQINGRPAVEIPPERASRMISGEDSYLSPTTSNRYLYHLRGVSSSASELVHAPAVNASVVFHYIPLMSAFGSDGSTEWPEELWDPAIYMAASLAEAANESPSLAEIWKQKSFDWLQSKGVKSLRKSKQEGAK